MMNSAMYCLSQAPLPPLDVWQEAVDGLGLLCRLELLSVVPVAGALSHARLEDRITTFLCEPFTPGTERRGVDVSAFAGWRFVMVFGEQGSHIESTAAAVACVACAAVTDGAVYLTKSGIETDLASLRQWLDFKVTYDLLKDELFYLRYPSERPTEQYKGPMEIVVTVM